MNQPPLPEPLKLTTPFNVALNPMGFQLAVSHDESTIVLIVFAAPGEAELRVDPEGKQKITIVMNETAMRGLRDILTNKLNDKRIILPGEIQ